MARRSLSPSFPSLLLDPRKWRTGRRGLRFLGPRPYPLLFIPAVALCDQVPEVSKDGGLPRISRSWHARMVGLAPKRERNGFDDEAALSTYLPHIWALFGFSLLPPWPPIP